MFVAYYHRFEANFTVRRSGIGKAMRSLARAHRPAATQRAFSVLHRRESGSS